MSTPIFPSFIIIDTPWLLHTLSAHFLDEENKKSEKNKFSIGCAIISFPTLLPRPNGKEFHYGYFNLEREKFLISGFGSSSIMS
jgi:hypothetical protein